MSGLIKALKKLANETLFDPTNHFKTLDMKTLTLMNNERLINIVLWKPAGGETKPVAPHPIICFTQKRCHSPLLLLVTAALKYWNE